MLIGYGRISQGEDQDDTLQVQALKAAGCTRIYTYCICGISRRNLRGGIHLRVR
jgi:DNA invertase Pin-like site-specific DNA recombinase